MDMIKYIVKRLLLSVLILFGVSVIIYSLRSVGNNLCSCSHDAYGLRG